MLGTQRVIGLDLGAATVKVGAFQVTAGQGLKLVAFNHAELGLDPEHEENRNALMVSTIRNVLREKGIKPGPTVFSVSGQSVFTRFVKLPPVDQSKVVQIIQYEAQQNVPFPIEEVCWDYQLIGSNAQGELEVVLLAIKNNIIEDLYASVAAAGLKAVKVDVAPMALYNAVRYNYGDLEGCTVMLDIGARTTNLLFIEQGKLFSRSIPIAGNAITQSIAAEFNIGFLDAEQMKRSGFVALGGAYEEPENERTARVSKIIRNIMTRLHAEVARSINFYRSQQGGSAPSRLFLSGGSSIIPYTDRFFQEKLTVPIEYFNPFRNVEIDAAISREELANSAHFFGEVVGLGLRQLSECPIEVNLMPSSLRAQRSGRQRRPYLAGAAACLVLVPLIWWAYTAKISALRELQIQNLSRQISALHQVKTEIERAQQQVEAVRVKARDVLTLAEQAAFWPALLEDLSQRLVENLYITSLSPVGGGAAGMTTRGAAPPPPMIQSIRGGGMPPPMMMGPEGFEPPTDTATVSTLRIQGVGAHTTTTADLNMVKQFADNLAESAFIANDGVTIDVLPNPMLKDTDPFFNFTLTVRLTRQLPL